MIRSLLCVFLGYETDTKGFILLNIHTTKLCFYERGFSYCKIETKGSEVDRCTFPNGENHSSQYPISQIHDPQVHIPINVSQPIEPKIVPTTLLSLSSTYHTSDSEETNSLPTLETTTPETNVSIEMNIASTPSYHSTRVRKPFGYLKDYYCYINMVSNTSSKVLYPLSPILPYTHLSSCYNSYVVFQNQTQGKWHNREI